MPLGRGESQVAMGSSSQHGKKHMAIGIASALSGALLWGFSGACAQVVLSDYGMSPLLITFVRSAIAAVALIALSLLRYRSELEGIISCGALRLRLALFGIGLFMSQSTFAASVASTNAGTATVLQSLATVFVMGIACVASRRPPRAFEVLGLAFALVSTWLIATQGDPMALAIAPNGLFWGIANALSVTLYIMVPKPLYAKWPSIPVISAGLCIAALAAGAAFGCEAAISGGVPLPDLDVYGTFVLVVGIGFLETACAFGLYLYGVAIVGSVCGSLLGTAEPASAMVLMVLWLGTAVTTADWLGLILMIAMVFLVALTSRSFQAE